MRSAQKQPAILRVYAALAAAGVRSVAWLLGTTRTPCVAPFTISAALWAPYVIRAALHHKYSRLVIFAPSHRGQ